MRLDVAAIAKGYAIDAAIKVLRDQGITHALVGGSGDMMAGDPPPGQPGWRIEVAPLDTTETTPSDIALLKNSAIATSGDMFQHVEINGVRYSHIVDPHTGVGLTDHSLVTVLGPDCTTADALGTAVSALGPKRGLELIEETPGLAVRIVRKPADKIEVRYSQRWASQIK
jgi:thiamine biosynthesis lipoprotein